MKPPSLIWLYEFGQANPAALPLFKSLAKLVSACSLILLVQDGITFLIN